MSISDVQQYCVLFNRQGNHDGMDGNGKHATISMIKIKKNINCC